MAGHVFISYSRSDRDYVERLVRQLQVAGVPVWYDYKITVGQPFSKEIQNAIDECAVFVPVMTPISADSEWVGIEIDYAHGLRRPIKPLLLRECKLPLILSGRHYEDVTAGQLPSPTFMAEVKALSTSPVTSAASNVAAHSPRPSPVAKVSDTIAAPQPSGPPARATIAARNEAFRRANLALPPPPQMKLQRILMLLGAVLAVVGIVVSQDLLMLLAMPVLVVGLVLSLKNLRRDMVWFRAHKAARAEALANILRG